MKNKKYAYCTSITRDFYIPCIILHKRIMDYLECKYPFVVLVTDEVTEDGIKELEEYGIIVKKIQFCKILQEDVITDVNYGNQTPVIFSVLSLTEYDLILNFEADILLLENIDKYFEEIEKYNFDDFYFFQDLCPVKYNKDNCFKEAWTQIFFCRPNQKTYNYLFNIIQKQKEIFFCDHDLIRIFYYHNTINNIKQDSLFKNYIHFCGQPKIWVSLFQHELIQNLFYKKEHDIELIYNFLNNYITRIKDFNSNYVGFLRSSSIYTKYFNFFQELSKNFKK